MVKSFINIKLFLNAMDIIKINLSIFFKKKIIK